METLGFILSTYLVVRIFGSFLGVKLFSNKTVKDKLKIIIVIILSLNISYLGLVVFPEARVIYFLYIFAGIALGIISPLRAALFSTHLDRSKEALDWASLDSVILLAMAIATATAGVIIDHFGFNSIFIMVAILNTLSAVPYIYLLTKEQAELKNN